MLRNIWTQERSFPFVRRESSSLLVSPTIGISVDAHFCLPRRNTLWLCSLIVVAREFGVGEPPQKENTWKTRAHTMWPTWSWNLGIYQFIKWTSSKHMQDGKSKEIYPFKLELWRVVLRVSRYFDSFVISALVCIPLCSSQNRHASIHIVGLTSMAIVYWLDYDSLTEFSALQNQQ